MKNETLEMAKAGTVVLTGVFFASVIGFVKMGLSWWILLALPFTYLLLGTACMAGYLKSTQRPKTPRLIFMLVFFWLVALWVNGLRKQGQ